MIRCSLILLFLGCIAQFSVERIRACLERGLGGWLTGDLQQLVFQIHGLPEVFWAAINCTQYKLAKVVHLQLKPFGAHCCGSLMFLQYGGESSGHPLLVTTEDFERALHETTPAHTQTEVWYAKGTDIAYQATCFNCLVNTWGVMAQW